MTATVSTNEKAVRKVNPALHNWKSNIRDNRKFSIILLILHLVAVPAVFISTMVCMYTNKGYDDGTVEMYASIAVCTTALAAFLGIFAATSSFTCLHEKSVVDMKLALPMNNTQRFFSNFLSGLFTYLAPFYTAQVISLLLCGYGLLFMEGKTFYEPRYIDNAYVDVPYVCDIFSIATPALLKLILGGTLCMLMLYVITVLIAICCGNKFEAIAYTILINILIPLTIFCVLYSMYDSLYGIESEIIALKVLIYTSVFGGIIASIDWASGGELVYGAEYMSYGVWLTVFTLVIAALFALCFFLYKKRRAEQVSKPFVFKLAYYIVLICAMFCIISLLLTEGADIVPTIIVSGIIFMIFEVVTNRGFKKFWLSIIKYAATFIAVVGIIVICEKTDGFGAVQRVPSAANVKSVEIFYDGFYGDFEQMNYNYDSRLLIKDKENIEAIVSAHQDIIDFYNANKDSYSRDNRWNYDDMVGINKNLTVTYNLKTGGSFSRDYYSITSGAAEYLSKLDVSEEYKRQVAEYYKKYILEAEKNYYNYIEANQEYADDIYMQDRFYAYAVNTMRIEYADGETNVPIDYLIAKDFFSQLAEAYYNDIMAITEENYYYSELHNVWSFHCAHFINNLMVPESFTNTVELLDYFDFNLVRIENFSDKDFNRMLAKFAASNALRFSTEDEYRKYRGVDEEAVLHASYDRYAIFKYEGENLVYDYDDNFIALLRAALPRNIVPENGYVIYVSGFTGAIPEELYDVAAGIKRSGYDAEKEAEYSRLAESLNNGIYADYVY
ncbi:MAG: hypothetical protein IJZ61_05815 [Oscillospiraceae bacterium]|nr:hypothetical protein [Oscillospiraceae bacterium]